MTQPFTAQLQDALKPLLAAGLSPDQVPQIITAFSPLIQNIFHDRVRKTFSEKEISALNQSGSRLSPINSISKLEAEYEKKTGQGFLDLYRDIITQLVPIITKTMADTKTSWQKLVNLGPEEIQRLAQAVDQKDAAAANKILS